MSGEQFKADPASWLAIAFPTMHGPWILVTKACDQGNDPAIAAAGTCAGSWLNFVNHAGGSGQANGFGGPRRLAAWCDLSGLFVAPCR